MKRRYKTPCRSCCGYEVIVVVAPALEPGKELVLVQCASCEVQRARYYRRARARH